MNSVNRTHHEVNTARIVASGISDVGHVRSENEDSIWLDNEGLVLLVADGMGGHERGAEASQTAIKNFRELLTPETINKEASEITAAAGVPPEIGSLYTIIYRAIGKTASFLSDRNAELKLDLFMGTTIVGLVLVADTHVLWFHIGDSRLYRWRDSSLEQLTADHSALVEWQRKGAIGTAPPKNLLTRVMGNNPLVEADIEYDKREKGDTFILCSDGLNDMVTDEKIEEILKAQNNVADIANSLVNEALAAGGRDNISVIVCKVQ
jgi:serine/threonine protein phosphatase PrpC